MQSCPAQADLGSSGSSCVGLDQLEVPQLASNSNPSDADASGVAPQAEYDDVEMASDGNSDCDVDMLMDMGLQPQPAVPPGRGGLPPAIGQLEDVFRWPTVALDSLSKLLGPSNIRSSLLGQPLTTSSHFSGIGTAEVAASMLRQAAAEFVELQPWRVAFVCENNTSCCKALSLRHLKCCILLDVLDNCVSDRLTHALASKSVDYRQVSKIIMDSFALGPQRCVEHEQQCSRTPLKAGVHIDISGSPCQPFSRAGKRKGTSDPRICLILGWIAWVKKALPYIVIHENVQDFEKAILHEHLENNYQIVHLVVRPADCGFTCINRVRLYSVLVRHGCVCVTYDIQAAFAHVRQVFEAARLSVPLARTFLGSAENALAEENKARAARSLEPVNQVSSDWTYLLTESQKRFLGRYNEKWLGARRRPPEDDPSCVFNLGQDPMKRCCWTSSKGLLPTLLHSGGRLWVPSLKRWLLPLELAAMSGFPVTEALARAGRVSVDTCSDVYTQAQLGNGMHVSSVGIVLMCVLACTRLQT